MRHSVSRLVALILRRPRTARPPALHRSGARARARLALATVPALVLAAAAAWEATDPGAAGSVDDEYRARLAIALTAQAEHPDRPLGLVIGSSRTTLAFAPELLSDPDGVYWVNGGRGAAGPIFDRLMLHRFLRDGVRPAVVVLEVMPLFFVSENTELLRANLDPRDLWVVRRYAGRPLEFEGPVFRARLRKLAGAPPEVRMAAGFVPACRPRGGYPDLEIDVAPAERARRIEVTRKNAEPVLRDFTVRPVAARAVRDTLREATGAGARVVLLRAPEGPMFRSWYGPAALARFDVYLDRLAAEFRAAVVDARFWLDEEDFFDSHHTLKRGAEKFTARFARELATLRAGP
jgi:hypothetical protein